MSNAKRSDEAEKMLVNDFSNALESQPENYEVCDLSEFEVKLCNRYIRFYICNNVSDVLYAVSFSGIELVDPKLCMQNLYFHTQHIPLFCPSGIFLLTRVTVITSHCFEVCTIRFFVGLFSNETCFTHFCSLCYCCCSMQKYPVYGSFRLR